MAQIARFLSCLALGLAWTRTRRSYTILQILFGLTHFSLSVLVEIIKANNYKSAADTNEGAIVRVPTTADKATLFATMIN